ncbi:hypothetical protein M0802_011822 [Mischocyttarus mexicanus]|nr:hypothetical protein M0802_011838 [Mischocyttarus mexicanus]KAI4487783.1 hypothetical protein M0802_011822 [Mischocyttarus mexicanus]
MKWSRGASRIIDVYHGVPQDVSVVCSMSCSGTRLHECHYTCIMYLHAYPMYLACACRRQGVLEEDKRSFAYALAMTQNAHPHSHR